MDNRVWRTRLDTHAGMQVSFTVSVAVAPLALHRDCSKAHILYRWIGQEPIEREGSM